MPKSYADLLREARAQIREVTPQEVDALPAGAATVVDVREASEWEQGHLPGALHISKSYIEQQIEGAVPDRDAPVDPVLRRRRPLAVRGPDAGRAWATRTSPRCRAASRPGRAPGSTFETPVVLTAEQKQRYSRHLLIPEVGVGGPGAGCSARRRCSSAPAVSARRRRSTSPPPASARSASSTSTSSTSATSSARSSTRTTGSASARSSRPGRRSTPSTPRSRSSPTRRCSSPSNVERIIAGYDVILDGTDTFETRYLLNDAAVAAGIPVVHASVFRFEGQLTTFIPYEGPCYRCLYPTPPPPELAPGCSVAGVLGVVPGIMGMLQANEALKVLLGIGEHARRPAAPVRCPRDRVHRAQAPARPELPGLLDAAVAARAAGRPLPGRRGRRRRAVPADDDRLAGTVLAARRAREHGLHPAGPPAERRRRQVARARGRLDRRGRRRARRAASRRSAASC